MDRAESARQRVIALEREKVRRVILHRRAKARADERARNPAYQAATRARGRWRVMRYTNDDI